MKSTAYHPFFRYIAVELKTKKTNKKNYSAFLLPESIFNTVDGSLSL